MQSYLRGELFNETINRIMPCYFKSLNHIVHGYNTDDYNLYANQIKVINAVKIAGPVSPAQISRVFRMKKGSLTTIIRSLVDMGLLKRVYSKTDSRKYKLILTLDGHNLLKEKKIRDNAIYQDLLADIPNSDFNKIVEGVVILAEHLEKKGVQI
jgi:MarR family transcriptional regulator, organic hydroperoxide resistance regulator